MEHRQIHHNLYEIEEFPYDEDDTLSSLLAKCDCISYPDDRQEVLRQLRRYDPKIDIREINSVTMQCDAIVAACRADPRRFEWLIRIVTRHESGTTADTLRDLLPDLTNPRPAIRWRHRQRLLELLSGCDLAPSLIVTLFRRCAPERFVLPEDEATLSGVLRLLADCNSEPGSPIRYPFLAMVELLAGQFPVLALDLRILVDAVARERGIPTAEVEAQRRSLDRAVSTPLDNQLVVLIDVEPIENEPGSYDVHSWLWQGGATRSCDDPRTCHGYEPLRQAVAEMIVKGVDSAVRQHGKLDLTDIDILLPREGLTWDIDQWLTSGRTRSRLGRRYRVNMRWRDRSECGQHLLRNPGDVIGAWRERWEEFIGGAWRGPYLCWLDDGDLSIPPANDCCLVSLEPGGRFGLVSSTHLIETLERHRRLPVLALPYAPPEQPDEPDLLYNALDLGTPVALWLRATSAGPESFRQVAMDLLAPGALSRLREVVWELRRSAPLDDPSHIGNALTLLWDDPRRQPPAPGTSDAPSFS